MVEQIAESEGLVDEARERPGEILKRAREAKKMSLTDVANATRVSQRQLEAIEQSDFGALPGTPYAVGFARAYARAVDADEVAIANAVREELGTLDVSERYEAFEPADPTHIPPRSLAWIAAALALLLAIGYGVWRTQFFSASTDQEIADIANRAEQAVVDTGSVEPSAPARPDGPVVLTAIEDVWLRIYDQGGERLFEKQMIAGEAYTVPPEANNPMILTGRPDALSVTIGGQSVAPLGPPEKTISDVPVSAAALLARGTDDTSADATESVPSASGRAPESSRSATSSSADDDNVGDTAAAPISNARPIASQAPAQERTRPEASSSSLPQRAVQSAGNASSPVVDAVAASVDATPSPAAQPAVAQPVSAPQSTSPSEPAVAAVEPATE